MYFSGAKFCKERRCIHALMTHIPVIVKDPYKPSYVTYFGWEPMVLIYSTLYAGGIKLYLLTHNMKYSVSPHPKITFPGLFLNYDSSSLCNNLFRDFRWSVMFFSDNYGIIYTRMYHTKVLEELINLLLENIGAVINPQ